MGRQHGYLRMKTSRDRPKSVPYPRLKNSKRTSQVSIYSTRKSKRQKMDRVARRDWRAKRGTLPKLSTFLSQLKGGPFGEKFFLKVSQCRKTERGDPLRFFNIHSVAKHKKIEEKIYFWEKISECRKKLKRGALWDFSTSILSQNIKKSAGGTLWGKNFLKKMSRSAETN